MSKKKTTKAVYYEYKNGEGEAFTDGEDFYMACCDCHLVHRVRVAINVDGKIIVRQWRENRITGQMRRHKGVPIKEVTK